MANEENEVMNDEDVYTQRHMAYPETTMFGALERAAKRFPKAIAYEFMGKKTNYTQMIAYFELAARALVAEGIQRGDVVTICLPNVPQAIVLLYALNRIGAVANMIHPLSSQKEITYFLDDSDSKMIFQSVNDDSYIILTEKDFIEDDIQIL